MIGMENYPTAKCSNSPNPSRDRLPPVVEMTSLVLPHHLVVGKIGHH